MKTNVKRKPQENINRWIDEEELWDRPYAQESIYVNNKQYGITENCTVEQMFFAIKKKKRFLVAADDLDILLFSFFITLGSFVRYVMTCLNNEMFFGCLTNVTLFTMKTIEILNFFQLVNYVDCYSLVKHIEQPLVLQ